MWAWVKGLMTTGSVSPTAAFVPETYGAEICIRMVSTLCPIDEKL